MNFGVTYQTKIVNVKKVTLVGELSYQDEGWMVKGSSREDYLWEWLEKFAGRSVAITIKATGEQDDSHLLQPEEIPHANDIIGAMETLEES